MEGIWIANPVMLTIVTYLWGSKYSDDDVARLFAGLKRNVEQPFNLKVMPIPTSDMPLTKIPGCFARLRLFDPEFQKAHGLTDRIVCIDLDVIVTGKMDVLLNRAEDFIVLGGANAVNKCPYNGSIWMLRAGAHANVWYEFSLEAAAEAMRKGGPTPMLEYPDDQGWFWHMFGNRAPTWKVGPQSGIYAYKKPGWPEDSDDLPSDARLVVFPGWRSPARVKHLQWVKEHWR